MSTSRLDGQGVIVPCASCGTANRLRYPALGASTRCASCHADLPKPGEPIEAPDAAVFDALIAASSLPVVVDFWAPWCGPCRVMAPELEKVARTAAGEWLVVKVDTDRIPELGERFRIRSIPTLALFERGREVDRVAGARPAGDIRTFVASHLGQATRG
jgi:thioredoxin 2